jgi:exoribonuclease R
VGTLPRAAGRIPDDCPDAHFGKEHGVPDHRLAGAPLDFSGLRVELQVPGDFSPAALACAQAAAQAVQLPELDRTDLELVTVDPPGSMDLDQAVHIATRDGGYLVSYAIADVGSFIEPGSALDEELQERGETIYFPDARVPLHPAVLSEGAASLLPDQVRPAVLWQFELDGSGAVTHVDVRRARVRSRARLDYAGVQASFDAGNPHPATRSTSTYPRRRSSASARPGPSTTGCRYRSNPSTPRSR